MTSPLGLTTRLLLALLVMVAPSLAVMAPDSPWMAGISDGSDSGGSDDGNRRGPPPLVTSAILHAAARPVSVAVRFRPARDEAAPDAAPESRSSRSPPLR